MRLDYHGLLISIEQLLCSSGSGSSDNGDSLVSMDAEVMHNFRTKQ